MRFSSSAVIKAILGLQIAVMGALVAGDVGQGWQGFDIGPRAPAMDRPVAPGDQRRR